MRGFLVMLLLATTPLAQAADPVGRIFYTPGERAQLNILRSQRTIAAQIRKEPIPEFVTYNGIVRRSDGKATVWVNGEALTEAGLREKASITGRIGRNGQILLQTPQATGTAQVQLKVGQSAELLSGRVDEPYKTHRDAPAIQATPAMAVKPADSVQIRRPGAPRESQKPDAQENPNTAPRQ